MKPVLPALPSFLRQKTAELHPVALGPLLLSHSNLHRTIHPPLTDGGRTPLASLQSLHLLNPRHAII